MPAQQLQRILNASPSMELALAEVRVAPGARHPEYRQRPERIELCEDEGSLEVPPGIVHSVVDRAGLEHPPQRIDEPVMDDDPAVRIDVANFLELAAGTFWA